MNEDLHTIEHFRAEGATNNRGNNLFPYEFKPVFGREGYSSQTVLVPRYNAAAEIMFFGNGIAGSLGYDSSPNESNPLLNLRVFSSNPQTDEEKGHIKRLVERLNESFESVEFKSEK